MDAAGVDVGSARVDGGSSEAAGRAVESSGRSSAVRDERLVRRLCFWGDEHPSTLLLRPSSSDLRVLVVLSGESDGSGRGSNNGRAGDGKSVPRVATTVG